MRENQYDPCPFCGAKIEQCDESPIYGESILHPKADCWLSENLIFRKDLKRFWNSRVSPEKNTTSTEMTPDEAKIMDFFTISNPSGPTFFRHGIEEITRIRSLEDSELSGEEESVAMMLSTSGGAVADVQKLLLLQAELVRRGIAVYAGRQP